ncbi:glycoside hydrolase [Blyttiomyces helicus]|uniref:Trehalase n=1 Tax=Blyttiomyces helicus TaxID=388810 RepID=A0A4P9WHY6_9FUNG|nr:glycoside hydrolase [Blyttiomyces helicus]|eukprot:RKO91585.1 glycoside hydrolase [Blyttiomyces helicus]
MPTLERTPSDDDPHRRRRRASHDEKVLGRPTKFLIDVEETQRLILAQEDTDNDCQITIHDAGPKTFVLGTANSAGYRKTEIRGTYMLSNLLQELALATDHGRRFIVLDEERLSENPLERLSRLIRFQFWDGLTRRIDAEGLEIICNDPKNRSKDQRPRIFVPFHDPVAFEYYTQTAISRPHLNLDVVRLPEIITPEYVKSLNSHPGILSLGLRQTIDPTTGETRTRGTPFVVPGGRFNEMYGWDSYFEAIGLLSDGRIELARGMVENFCYEIEHYGKILNANRSYYLTRSQPPFLTDMVRQVHARLPEKGWTAAELKAWLAQGLRAAVKELFSVWLTHPRLDAVVGLSKYRPEGLGIPPETEASHFSHVLEPFAQKRGLDLEEFMRMYNSGDVKEPELDEYFMHDRAVRESGHDTTYRFEKRCANLATIDLNSLVYKYEADLATFIDQEFDGRFSPTSPFFTLTLPSTLFAALAARTQSLISTYLWDPATSLFTDYDCAEHERSTYQTVTALWPLWAGCATPAQIARLVPAALETFEVRGGLVSGTEESRGAIGIDRPNRQWDYPFGWAPHQMMAWPALANAGFDEDAARVAYRWLFTILQGFVDFNGVVPEKFDVVDMTHRVDVEYGNVGTDFRFVVREGFGWMNASFQVGWAA